ncbi:MAG: UDP-glucuronic acid decarboxylase family protein [Patescibacteria group bacterium]
MKHYLVCGGAGFLGANLVDRLLNEGERVTIVDNLITGLLSNIEEFKSNPNFRFLEHDVRRPLPINDKIDYVLNYACPASPLDYRRYPVETLEVSSVGVKNLLELAKKHQARFFHTSTSEVYGDPLEHPQTEKYWGRVNSYGERSCYDEAKRYAEALIYIYRKDFGVNTGLIRIFNTYGPKMKPFDGRVVSTFIRQALAGKDLTVFGEGRQTRSFCYVDDQIEANLRMIRSDIEGPINIGNPEEFTMLELAEKVLALTGSKSKIIHKPLPEDDPGQRRPDISLAKKELDWEPKVKLKEGLKKTIEWFKRQKSK